MIPWLLLRACGHYFNHHHSCFAPVSREAGFTLPVESNAAALEINAPLANFAEEFAGVGDEQKRAAIFDQGIEEPRIRLTA
jgi:hypothetical protein